MEESERRKVQLQSPNGRKTTKVEATKDDNEKQQHLEFDLKKDKSKFGEQIVEQGAARINSRLSKETAASLLEYNHGYLEEALTIKVEGMRLEDPTLWTCKEKSTDRTCSLRRKKVPLSNRPVGIAGTRLGSFRLVRIHTG